MNEKTGCSRCGKPAARDDLMGLCPDCLLAEGLGSVADATAAGHRVRFVPPEVSEVAPLFPQLEVLEPLGCGGMGAVYKARQKNLDRFVALKILPAGIGSDPAFAARFSREAKALAKLSHTNIVTLYEFGQAGNLFYFLMEYVDGVNLGQLLRSGRVSPREALAIVPQICDALQYAHDAGIVHRDIKPENILLDRKGRVKVADFGLAKLVGSASSDGTNGTKETDGRGEVVTTTEAGHVMGTPQYMAPEQVAHPSEVDHRADIYSLGVVFYQMLTGELPKGDFAPPSKKVVVDVRLDEVVLRAMEKRPELRYQQVSDVKTMVETIATTPPPSAAEATLAAKPDAWMWAPNQPPLVREICAHMTAAEKWDAGKSAMVFGLWSAATFFGLAFCIMFMHGVVGCFFGLVILAIGLSFYPRLLRVQKELLCSTAWAQQQGIKLEQIKRFEGTANSRGRVWLGSAGIAAGLVLLAGSTLIVEFVDDHSLTHAARANLTERAFTSADFARAKEAVAAKNKEIAAAKKARDAVPPDQDRTRLFEREQKLIDDRQALELKAVEAESNMNVAAMNKQSYESLLTSRICMLAVILVVLGSVPIIRAVWRAVNKGGAPQVPVTGKTGAADSQSLENRATPPSASDGRSSGWLLGMSLLGIAMVAGLLLAVGTRLLVIIFLTLLLLMKLVVFLLKPKWPQQSGSLWRSLAGSAAAQVAAATPLLFFGVFIVPKFVEIARDLGATLPLVVAVVVNAIEFVNCHGWLMGGLLAVAALMSGIAYGMGGPVRLRRWTIGVAAALFALFVVTVATVIIPMMMYAPQVIHRNPAGSTVVPTAPDAAAISEPPFIADYPNGTVELVALAPLTHTNAPCWLPDGRMSKEKFSYCGAKSWVRGMEMNEIAFRIHSRTGAKVAVLVKYGESSGVSGLAATLKQVDRGTPYVLFNQNISCPLAARTVNVVVGIDDEPRKTEESNGYQWVEFRNVSLQPGHRTTVEVVGGHDASRSQALVQEVQSRLENSMRKGDIDLRLDQNFRQRLNQVGATCESTFVEVADDLQSATVSFSELKNFPQADGTRTGLASGHFLLTSAGNGNWEGTLMGVPVQLIGEASSPLIIHATGQGDRAVLAGRAARNSVIECGIAGEGQTITASLPANGNFTALVASSRGGLGLAAQKPDFGFPDIGQLSSSMQLGNRRLTDGRIFIRDGERPPEPDGSYFIADFHPTNGAPVPVYVRVRAARSQTSTTVPVRVPRGTFSGKKGDVEATLVFESDVEAHLRLAMPGIATSSLVEVIPSPNNGTFALRYDYWTPATGKAGSEEIGEFVVENKNLLMLTVWQTDMRHDLAPVSGLVLTRQALPREAQAVKASAPPWKVPAVDGGDPGAKARAEVSLQPRVPAEARGPRLQFRLVAETNSAGATDDFPDPNGGTNKLRLLRDVLLDETAVASATMTNSTIGSPDIDVAFTDAGARRFAEITRDNLNRRLAIIFDGVLLSAPTIRSEISGGRAVIAGKFNPAEALAISLILNHGAEQVQPDTSQTRE